jgi:hypothetical protein
MRVAPYPGDVATTAERLAAVTAGIDALIAGRVKRYSVSTGGTVRTFEYHDLGELRKLEADLRAQLATETQGGIRMRLARPGWS